MYTDLYFSLQYQVKGEGEAEGTTYFLPPGISMDDKDNVISSPTQNESNTSSAQNVNNKEEDEEDDGPWDCPSCGYTNTTSKARCTNILRDNTGDGRQDKCMAWREGKRKKYFKKIKNCKKLYHVLLHLLLHVLVLLLLLLKLQRSCRRSQGMFTFRSRTRLRRPRLSTIGARGRGG